MVIEDDHFSAVSAQPYQRATPKSTGRWALIRSVSKFLGPDLRVAFVAADPATAAHLERPYRTRSQTLAETLAGHGITVETNVDGLNIWIALRAPEQLVVNQLARFGWAVRAGADLAVTREPTNAIRVTTASMSPEQAAAFSDDLSQVLAELAA